MKHTFPLLILILLALSCGSDGGKKGVERPVVSGVKTEVVRKTEAEEFYRTSGTVKAGTISDVASRVMGRVTSIKVEEGDRVAEGEVLMTIEDADIRQKALAAKQSYRIAENAFKSAEHNKRLSELTYDRYRNLYNERAISLQEMDEIETRKDIAALDYEKARAALNQAKANANEAQVNLGFATIRSPSPGIVTEKNIEVGSMATPGAPLLRVEDDSTYRIDVNVDESLYDKLSPGMPVTVELGSSSRKAEGTVTEVVPAVDPRTRTFLVKIAIDGEPVKTGQYARVLIPVGRKEALVVPKQAVVEKGQLVGVYTVGKDGVVNYRLIRTGNKYDGGVEVLSGLKAGDTIIVEGTDKAVDGGVLEQN